MDNFGELQGLGRTVWQCYFSATSLDTQDELKAPSVRLPGDLPSSADPTDNVTSARIELEMPAIAKRWLFVGTIALILIVALYKSQSLREDLELSGLHHGSTGQPRSTKWTRYKQRYPVSSYRRLPSGKPRNIPIIQHAFGNETPEERQIREERQRAVKESFAHGWKGYRERAWGKDEVTPVTGMYRTTFGGWAATLVDSLDTLWMMGFETEFDEAVAAVAQIDFTTPQSDIINVFETTIRYLGGLLGAYDLSGREILLEKAVSKIWWNIGRSC